MENQERYKLIADFEAYLESERNDATPEELRSWLIALNHGTIANTTVHPRAIVRGITINYMMMERAIRQLERTIERLDTENDRTQRLVVVLTYVTIIVGVAQIVVPLLIP